MKNIEKKWNGTMQKLRNQIQESAIAILLDAKVVKMKKQIPQIKYSNLKSVTSYVADLEGDKKAFKLLENVGRKVMTEQEYVLIGFNHIFNKVFVYLY